MSERAGGTAGNPENNAPPSLQLRDLLERAIFYLGIPAVTLYPLGVLFYWIQIRSHYDISADVTWQAVFTIPREFIIAKTAAMVVEGFAFATPDLLLTALLIYVPITIGWRRAWGTGWRTNPLRRILTLLALIFVVLWALFMVYLIVTGLQVSSVRRAAAIYQILTIAAALLAGYLVATDRKKNRTSPNLAMAPIFVRRWFMRGALVAYMAVIIGIFILGSSLPIQLPTITFGEGSQRQNGLLLGDPGPSAGTGITSMQQAAWWPCPVRRLPMLWCQAVLLQRWGCSIYSGKKKGRGYLQPVSGGSGPSLVPIHRSSNLLPDDTR